MAVLKSMFKKTGAVLGEAILAVAGIGTIYGLGWLNGLRTGSKLEERLADAVSNLDSDNMEDMKEELDEAIPDIVMAATEEDSDQQED